MNLSLFVSLLIILQLAYWFVGRSTSKNVKGKEAYFLAEKNVRFFPLMMTFLATQVGGGIILGSAEEAYRFGWPVLFYPIGSALGLILLGCGIGKKLASFPISTVAQIFEVVYKSSFLKKTASIFSVLSLFMILVAQVIASNKFFISLGIDQPWLFILFWTIGIIYTAQGGLKAVISTDTVQAIFFSCMFFFAFGFVLFTNPSLPSIQMPEFGDVSHVSSKLWGWLLMPLLFMIIEQDMGQRCFAGASSKIVSKASFFAGIFTFLVCLVPIFFGSFASHIGLEVPKGGSVLMSIIAKTTNPWITALVGCAILAAIISTATSLINAIGANLSNDFKLSFLRRSDPTFVGKAITCLISIGAIFFAFYFDNVVDLLIQSYELSVSCLFVPIILALFRRKGHFLSALLSIVFGALAFLFFRIYPIEFPREVASILFSLLGYGCGEIRSLYQNKTSQTTEGNL